MTKLHIGKNDTMLQLIYSALFFESGSDGPRGHLCQCDAFQQISLKSPMQKVPFQQMKGEVILSPFKDI